MTATLDCENSSYQNLDGEEVATSLRAFSVMANAPIPYEAEEFYFEIEVLEDPGKTGYVCIHRSHFPYLLFSSKLEIPQQSKTNSHPAA